MSKEHLLEEPTDIGTIVLDSFGDKWTLVESSSGDFWFSPAHGHVHWWQIHEPHIPKKSEKDPDTVQTNDVTLTSIKKRLETLTLEEEITILEQKILSTIDVLIDVLQEHQK